MRTFVVVLALAAVALAAPKYEPIFQDYHEEVGIPEYESIRAGDEAQDFDGARIAGGSHAALGQYPFMGGIIIHLADGRTSTCGSSLLTNHRAVTAAHCWRHRGTAARSFTLVFGSIRLNNGGTRVDTNTVDMHAQYNDWSLHNDIAIVHFSYVAYNNHINRINLASGSNLFVGTYADAIGFGRKGDNVGIAQNQPLSHVRLPVISNADCARVYGPTVIASTICISGAGGRSTCPGDSGGPLAVGSTLIGVTSFGSIFGCTQGFPAGFARVSAFHAWISARL